MTVLQKNRFKVVFIVVKKVNNEIEKRGLKNKGLPNFLSPINSPLKSEVKKNDTEVKKSDVEMKNSDNELLKKKTK